MGWRCRKGELQQAFFDQRRKVAVSQKIRFSVDQRRQSAKCHIVVCTDRKQDIFHGRSCQPLLLAWLLAQRFQVLSHQRGKRCQIIDDRQGQLICTQSAMLVTYL